LSDIKPTDIQKFYTGMLNSPGASGRPIKARTVEHTGAILKKALRYAVEVEGALSFNPASRVPLPKSDAQAPAPWNRNELATFLEEAKSHRLFFFYRLSAYTGARRGELLALRWSDFDSNYITISKSRTLTGRAVVETNTTKGGKGGQRRVKLDRETIELFGAHRKRQIEERLSMGSAWTETGYVFVREDGKPLGEWVVTQLFIKTRKLAGLRHNRLHDLRHLHATELLRLGEPLHVVSKRLGHADPMVTATIYAHVSDEQADTASSTFANGARLAN
jgi:integrase